MNVPATAHAIAINRVCVHLHSGSDPMYIATWLIVLAAIVIFVSVVHIAWLVASRRKVASLTRELRQTRQRNAATADVLKVLSRSSFDLQAMLDSLVKS